jgi:hypothetical protein
MKGGVMLTCAPRGLAVLDKAKKQAVISCLCVSALVLVSACGTGSSSPGASTGGTTGASGGATGASGGATGATAGNTSSGGASGSGGVASTGGMIAAGGSTGGTSASGGATSTGGNDAAGGRANGGTSGGGAGGRASGGSSAGGAGGNGGGGGAAVLPDPSKKKAAYIYGSISANGMIPAPAGQEYEQMRLTDTGNTGCSQYRTEIEQLGYSITEVYDRTTTFDLAFLNQYNVIIFGNHQKVMTTAEQEAIATWVSNGGGLLAYSDSAFGGKYDVVGISNTVGQKAVNSIISQFGIQVLTDQGNGTCAMKGADSDTHPIIYTGGTSLVIEGEGESPVCVDRNAGVKILIPFTTEAKVGSSGTVSTNNVGGGMTITNPLYAALALKEHGKGRVIAQFDRQMLWNNGPGSSITQKDNREIQKRIFLYLAHAL